MKRVNKFIERANRKHDNKYTYNKETYVDRYTEMEIICPEHGMFKQSPYNHMRANIPCPKCRPLRRITTKEYIRMANEIHGNEFDYSETVYDSMHKKIKIICPIHGQFLMKAGNHLHLKQKCPKCRPDNISKTKINQKAVIFEDRAKEIHGDKYDYSLVNYTHSKNKVKIICPEHGIFEQTPNQHLRGHGCYICSNKYKNIDRKLSKEDFLQRSGLIHNFRYNYDKVEYKDLLSKVVIICPLHGEFNQTPHNHMYDGCGCPKCSNRTSKQERFIENFLIKNKIKYIHNDREVIEPLELDFYLPDYKIAIECNGIYWHSELHGKGRKYHLNKTNLCKENGVKLLHIYEDEIKFKEGIVISRLKSLIGLIKYKIFARKCEVREIDLKLKSKFLNKYHIQGDDRSSIRLGLFYHDRLVAVMTFGKNRFIKIPSWELIRYVTVSNFTVLGGAGKLLKYFERNYNPINLRTYADIRWSNGDLYKQLGFDYIHDSAPNYFYFKDSIHRQNRLKFQKHKLSNKLENFDPMKSEWENMKINGWNRIWDCGTMVFEKKY